MKVGLGQVRRRWIWWKPFIPFSTEEPCSPRCLWQCHVSVLFVFI